MKKVFIGVDFSKLKFDAVLLIQGNKARSIHHIFDNEALGYKEFVKWIKSNTSIPKKQWLICGEHTGLYSLNLTKYLNQTGIDIWLENPLQIKRSMGIKRGKTDKVDALHIALYAYRFQDRAISTKLKSDVLDQIKDLQAYRKRLVNCRVALEVSSKELAAVKNDSSTDFIVADSQIHIQLINAKLKEINKKIKALITCHQDLFLNYKLLTSIKGIGPENAIMVLVLTGNFTLFNDPRKFGCYSGVVPFSHSSGSSIKSKDKVSELANKKMKTLLTEAVRAAIRYDKNINDYYIRKLQDGKDRFLVLNNVRNKLIHRMFAVVKNKTPYNPQYEQSNNNFA
ncbi:IS110 family transposase [Dysgonomonas sp. 521]|uniref:IS110 family transposase n=1 Tax=Dysgonomonas sp. 521 TaxID=2302932 RepID=UPI0013D45FBB|nr:IS110 family transposase [Dysgonomonas sp. 521]NDV97606.1 IS110 family transposase [Dysgonomonas sp. 521]